jgi:hypothetical protein
LSQPISKAQISEWTENPVTIALKEQIKLELQEIRETSPTGCLISGKPHKSHENLVELEARERVWEDIYALFDGDWTYFEEDDEE